MNVNLNGVRDLTRTFLDALAPYGRDYDRMGLATNDDLYDSYCYGSDVDSHALWLYSQGISERELNGLFYHMVKKAASKARVPVDFALRAMERRSFHPVLLIETVWAYYYTRYHECDFSDYLASNGLEWACAGCFVYDYWRDLVPFKAFDTVEEWQCRHLSH